jgi:hypothetical protein
MDCFVAALLAMTGLGSEVHAGAEAVSATSLPDGPVEFVVVGEVGKVELKVRGVAADFATVA